MLYIDFEAATEAEAVQLALDSLGLTRDDITYEVLEKEKKGLSRTVRANGHADCLWRRR